MRYLSIAALTTCCAACNLLWGTDGLQYQQVAEDQPELAVPSGAAQGGAAEGGAATGGAAVQTTSASSQAVTAGVGGYGGGPPLGGGGAEGDGTGGAPPQPCGNGVLDNSESCDDANTVDGDGCSSTCQLDAGADPDTCANEPTFVLGAAGVVIAGTTAGATNDTGGELYGPCDSASPPDHHYAIKSSFDGEAKFTVTGNFDLYLVVRGHCSNLTSTEHLCATSTSAASGNTVSLQQNTVYHVVLSSTAATGDPSSPNPNSFGDYELTIRYQ